MKTFERWCEDNGRRHTGASSFKEFKRNADDYTRYREQENDKAAVGTPDYKGLAYFWNREYRHTLRECPSEVLVQVHQSLLDAGLEVDGHSHDHDRVIYGATYEFQQANPSMFP